MAKQTKKTETSKPAPKAAKEKKAVAPKSAKPEKTTTVKKTKATQQESRQFNAVEVYSRFTDFDIALFKSGKHYKLYEKFGSHVMEVNGIIGTYFSVWAPNAQHV